MRAIDADALEKVLKDKGIYPAVVRRAIADAPTLDVVPVVRCRGCKYNRSERKCLRPDSVMITPDDNDFCSYGKQVQLIPENICKPTGYEIEGFYFCLQDENGDIKTGYAPARKVGEGNE